MTKFAKDAPAEMLPRFLTQCQRLIKNKGACHNEECKDCPGYKDHNESVSCISNGWAGDSGEWDSSHSDCDDRAAASAQAFIDYHTQKPAKAVKKPLPTHIQEELDKLSEALVSQEECIKSLATYLTAARSKCRVIRAALVAARKQAKKENAK